MSKVIIVTTDTFEETVLKSEGLVLVDFGATWCGPCKMMKPIIDQLAEENESVKIINVDIDNDPTLAANYGVRSIPTFIFYKNGEIVDKQVGAIPKTVLSNKIDKLK